MLVPVRAAIAQDADFIDEAGSRTVEGVPAEPVDADALVRVLVGAETSAAGRVGAAERLVEGAAAQVPGTLDALIKSLSDDQPIEARRAVLQAIAGSQLAPPNGGLADTVLGMRLSLPGELEQAWAKALGRYELERIADTLAEVAGEDQADLDQRRLAVRALGEHRRLFAATKLVELTSVNRLPQVQGWAFDALASLSHQPGIGRDRSAWADWYNQARRLSASQWQRMLHENLLRLTRERDEADRQIRDRLIQSQRALYRATEPEQRPALLTQLLQDPLEQVRMLAMDLARQRLEDSGEFGPELREQLRERLDDPLARIREESATLLGQLLDAEAADIMAQRLRAGRELEMSVRRAHMTALTQMPRAEALGAAYEMLPTPSLQAGAAGMLAAAYRAEQGEPAFWNQVRDRVRTALQGVESPRPQMVTLLGLVIAEDDTKGWERIGGWLSAEDDRLRGAAARVWAGSSRSLAVLAERSDDAVIRPIALKAIAERGSRKETLKAVAARRPEEPEDIRLWEQAMIAMAGRVAPGALLGVIDGLADHNGETRQVREHMLTASIDRKDRPDPPDRDDLRVLIARAKTRVLDDAPALVVLDYEAALQHADTLTQTHADDARRGLAGAYLADRRLDDALAASAQLLKPAGELIDSAAQDPLIESLVAAAARAAEQGRKDDALKLIAGVRSLLGESIDEQVTTDLQSIQEALDKPPADPATAPTPS